MRKKIAWIFTLVLAISLLVGCGSKNSGGTEIYYLNMDMTNFEVEDYEATSTSQEDLVQELLNCLQTDPEDSESRRPIQDFAVNSYTINGNYLTLDFDSNYYNLSVLQEVITRAAIVKTLTQISDITYVSFTVDGSQLVDSDGMEVGVMTADSFVENPGDSINSTAQTTLTLYFASSDGTSLKKETRTVHYSSNISMDKLVIEQLIAGPKSSGLQGVIPSGTRLVTVSTVDGVCYVSLSENFENQDAEISEAVVLYSIVDSLTELPDVDKVQISINGSTTGKVRYDYDLSEMYEANLDLLNAKTSEEQTEETTAAATKIEDEQEETQAAITGTAGDSQAEAGVSSDLKTEKTEN